MLKFKNAVSNTFQAQVFMGKHAQRCFVKKLESNDDLIDNAFKQQELKALEDTVTPAQKEIMDQDRLTMLATSSLESTNNKNWFVRLKTMTPAEMKLLPYGFLKKYGTFIHFLRRMEKEGLVRENKKLNGWYDQIAKENELVTDDVK